MVKILDWILFPIFKLGFYYSIIGLLFAVVYCNVVPAKEVLMSRAPLPRMAMTGICSMLGDKYTQWTAYVFCAVAWPFIGYQEIEEAIQVIKKPKS